MHYPPTTQHPLLPCTTHPRPTTHHPLLTTHCPPTSHFPLPTHHYYLKALSLAASMLSELPEDGQQVGKAPLLDQTALPSFSYRWGRLLSHARQSPHLFSTETPHPPLSLQKRPFPLLPDHSPPSTFPRHSYASPFLQAEPLGLGLG